MVAIVSDWDVRGHPLHGLNGQSTSSMGSRSGGGGGVGSHRTSVTFSQPPNISMTPGRAHAGQGLTQSQAGAQTNANGRGDGGSNGNLMGSLRLFGGSAARDGDGQQRPGSVHGHGTPMRHMPPSSGVRAPTQSLHLSASALDRDAVKRYDMRMCVCVYIYIYI
jgi:hypothetical protein